MDSVLNKSFVPPEERESKIEIKLIKKYKHSTYKFRRRISQWRDRVQVSDAHAKMRKKWNTIYFPCASCKRARISMSRAAANLLAGGKLGAESTSVDQKCPSRISIYITAAPQCGNGISRTL